MYLIFGYITVKTHLDDRISKAIISMIQPPYLIIFQPIKMAAEKIVDIQYKPLKPFLNSYIVQCRLGLDRKLAE